MARDYCFTAWEIPKFDEDNVKYICWGEEICPTTGKLHYQGFVMFNRTARIPKAKVWIGASDRTHVEVRNGTRMGAREYCMKDGKFSEHGQFEPMKIEDIFKLPLKQIKEEYPLMYCRYHRGIEKLKEDRGPKWRPLEVVVLWGKSGTGKTRQVMEMDDVYKIDPPYSWWDGYSGESILCIDDYQPGAIARGALLNILDGYRLRLEVKGGHTWALWTKVFITTNCNPITWEFAISRRVTSVRAVG